MSEKKVIIIGPAYPYRGGIANFNNSLSINLDTTYKLINYNYEISGKLPRPSENHSFPPTK